MAKRLKKSPPLPTFREIIGLWDSIKQFGDDIEVKDRTARAMSDRDSIHLDHWPALVEAAKKRRYKTKHGESVTLDLLARIAAARRRRPSKNPSRRAIACAA